MSRVNSRGLQLQPPQQDKSAPRGARRETPINADFHRATRITPGAVICRRFRFDRIPVLIKI
jgi:hypothetical protein